MSRSSKRSRCSQRGPSPASLIGTPQRAAAQSKIGINNQKWLTSRSTWPAAAGSSAEARSHSTTSTRCATCGAKRCGMACVGRSQVGAHESMKAGATRLHGSTSARGATCGQSGSKGKAVHELQVARGGTRAERAPSIAVRRPCHAMPAPCRAVPRHGMPCRAM